VLFRSLRSLAGRTLAAGAASAVALTLFNAAQPSLGTHKVQPGTVKNVQLSLVPAPAPTVAPAAPGAVDSQGRAAPGSATLPHRGPEPGAGRLQAAPGGAGAASGLVAVGAAGGGEGSVRGVLLERPGHCWWQGGDRVDAGADRGGVVGLA